MKRRIFRLPSITQTLLITVAVIGSISIGQAPQAAAHHAADCSDVYTPLSSFVINGANSNKSAYIQVMNETGVPWEMLAAIHYRETNFSRTNPHNGQGIFQFVNGDGGPYPPGPVSEAEFIRQLRFMANRVQNDYVNRGSVPRERRKLVPNEPNITIVKDTLFSYNGRAQAYINQAGHFGYNTTTQPYEGSPYVMNRFDCPRARMGIITRDYATGIDSNDTRYGAFTVYARLRGDDYWRALTLPYAWQIVSQESFTDSSRSVQLGTHTLRPGQRMYLVVKARNIGNTAWTNTGSNPVRIGTTNNRSSTFCDSSWVVTCNRPAQLAEANVPPGSIGTFMFWVKAPTQLGNYNEYFNLLAEGKSWMNDIGMHYPFGVKADTYTWQFSGQSVYADSARTKSLEPSTLAPNATYYVRIRAKNMGNVTWQRGQINLATSNPNDRTSVFRDGSWLAGNRAATLVEASVAPGHTGTFEFSVRTPGQLGDFKEYFRPVAEGKSWMNDQGLYIPFGVKAPVYQWSYQGQAVYTNSAKTQVANVTKVANDSRLFAVLKAKNVGNTTWTNGGAHPINLGASGPNDRTSVFRDGSWLAGNRAAQLKEASVTPGEIGTFEFWVNAPYALNGSQFKEYFRPVAEGKSWMNDIGMHYPFTMLSTDYAWSYGGQGVYTNAARTIPANTSALSRDTTYYLRLKARNVGGKAWQRGQINLATSNPNDRTSVFRDGSWLAGNRAATLVEASVAPGHTGTFEFSVRTPLASGSHDEYFRPVAEGVSWLNDLGLYWQLDVQ